MVDQPAYRREAVAAPMYISWGAVIAGAIAASALTFVLITFGAAIGLAIASPSATWRDTSVALALLSGLWLLLTAIASFALGGYLAGRLRATGDSTTADEVELRDGMHGLLVWGLAILIGAALALGLARTAAAPATSNVLAPTASTAEPLLAFELDRLFRADRRPGEAVEPDVRAQAAENHHHQPWACGHGGRGSRLSRSLGHGANWTGPTGCRTPGDRGDCPGPPRYPSRSRQRGDPGLHGGGLPSGGSCGRMVCRRLRRSSSRWRGGPRLLAQSAGSAGKRYAVNWRCCGRPASDRGLDGSAAFAKADAHKAFTAAVRVHDHGVAILQEAARFSRGSSMLRRPPAEISRSCRALQAPGSRRCRCRTYPRPADCSRR